MTSPGSTKPEGGEEVVIRRGRVASVDLFEIKDSELELFEKGSPADLQLNFANILASLAVTAIVALVTATFQNGTTKTIFIVAAVVGVLLGTYLYVSWWRNHKSLRDVCKTIRERIPPDVRAEPGESAAPPPKPQ